MTKNTPIKLRIPRQDKSAFELFAATAEGARAWAAELPITNTRLVVNELRHALDELNHVDMAPDLRFNILEALRPNLQVALASLSRSFLNQPVFLPQEPRQMWKLAESLYSLASTAYTLVAVHTMQRRAELADINPARQVCEAIQRALQLNGSQILHTLQLHQPVDLHGWLSLHQLYMLAERNKLERLPVNDPIVGETCIVHSYLQALMLGACKPNQLRQSDLAGIYRGMRDWVDAIAFSPDLDDSLFIVDLDRDQPPVYANFYAESASAQCRYINCSMLIEQLKELQANLQKQRQHSYAIDSETSIPLALLSHLITALGSVSMRNFTRSASSDNLAVTIGLSSVHYHIAGKRSLPYVIYGDGYVAPASDMLKENPFLRTKSSTDAWDQSSREDLPDDRPEKAIEVDDASRAVFSGTARETEMQAEQTRHRVHDVAMINASPGGYCLEWNANLPVDIRTGDLIAIKESNTQVWVLAVLRWVSQLESERTLVGVELLSPRGKAYAARVQQTSPGDEKPMRALMLPEIKLVGQPSTLILPRTGLRNGQQLLLFRFDEEFYVELLQQVRATASFVQFNFRYINTLEQAEDDSSTDVYESLWSKI